jgi:hypothetical protein
MKENMFKGKTIKPVFFTVLSLTVLVFILSACFSFPAVVAGPYIKDGTYTFYPRIQATRAGRNINAYLDKITVREGNVIVSLTAWPEGNSPYAIEGGWNFAQASILTLTDLDNPARTYAMAERGGDGGFTNQYVAFQDVRETSRLRLTYSLRNPPVVFNEIVLGEPDRNIELPPLRSGTYTFNPRLRAKQTGRDVDVYLDRIAVTDGYFIVCINETPEGTDRSRRIDGNWANRNAYASIVLRNLDYPSKSYLVVDRANENGTAILVFENVTGSRFALYDIGYDAKLVDSQKITFDEIILENPD